MAHVESSESSMVVFPIFNCVDPIPYLEYGYGSKKLKSGQIKGVLLDAVPNLRNILPVTILRTQTLNKGLERIELNSTKEKIYPLLYLCSDNLPDILAAQHHVLCQLLDLQHGRNCFKPVKPRTHQLHQYYQSINKMHIQI